MTKTLGAAMLLFTVIAAPLAQASSTHHGRTHSLKDFRAAYDQLGVPSSEGRWNVDNHRFDPSRPGDLDPSFNPSGS